jgi:hypothetical protein
MYTEVKNTWKKNNVSYMSGSKGKGKVPDVHWWNFCTSLTKYMHWKNLNLTDTHETILIPTTPLPDQTFARPKWPNPQNNSHSYYTFARPKWPNQQLM